jgi:tRNA nucleotidyltransferase (CCA-adding enzyme)
MHVKIKLPANVGEIIDRLEEEGRAAYAVGGCVRDSLLGRPPKDWDICTSATPDEACRIFGVEAGIGTPFGTVSINGVEVTSFRREGPYGDRRRPDSVEFVTSLCEDLKRRDFTVNAMAYNYASGLTDPFGGLEDLKSRLIRCVGEPKARFSEDCLRILRALRFSSQLGFEIESGAAKAALLSKDLILTLPPEVFFREFLGILEGENAAAVLKGYADILRLFIPEGDFGAAADSKPGVENRLRALLVNNASAVLERLHAPRSLKKALRSVYKEQI